MDAHFWVSRFPVRHHTPRFRFCQNQIAALHGPCKLWGFVFFSRLSPRVEAASVNSLQTESSSFTTFRKATAFLERGVQKIVETALCLWTRAHVRKLLQVFR